MFCDEPILRVYLGRNEFEHIEGSNYYFDFFKELVYHVTEEYRVVLETENWDITLDVNGVLKEPKASFVLRNGEVLEDGIELMYPDDKPYISVETTLFVGEKLHDVTKLNNTYICEFDDFTLKIIPYELGTLSRSLRNKNFCSYNYVLGCDRHITSKCKCGGDGEILIDFVSDYVVRCKKCNLSTWANMELQSAINDWNSGELHCVLDDITIE